MRVLLVAAIVLIAALAGCSGKKGEDDEIHYTCPDGTVMHSDDFEGVIANFTEDQTKDFLKTKCPKAGGSSGSKTNSTTLGPNVLPVLKLNITDSGGNVTNVTLKDGNLTFDATGSNDPDGQLSAIAISVKDSNQTRTKPLYDITTKKFTKATFNFDRAGPVNVSIAMVDDRAGFTTVLTQVFVNQKEHKGSETIYGPASTGPQANACTGASDVVVGVGHEIVDSQYFKNPAVTSVPGLMWIEVIPDSSNSVTICDPDGNAISPTFQSTRVISDPAGPLPTPAATKNYYVGVYAKSAGPATVSIDIITHYEPKPAAAA